MLWAGNDVVGCGEICKSGWMLLVVKIMLWIVVKVVSLGGCCWL